jgi:hypothetical protein
MDLLTTIVLGIVGSLIAAELTARSGSLAEWLIRLAVKRLPESEQSRFHEEWQAHLAQCSSNLTKIWHSVGCYIGSIEVARIVERRSHAKAPEKTQNDTISEVRIELADPKFKNAWVLVGSKGSGKTVFLANVAASDKDGYGAVKASSKSNRRKSRKHSTRRGR